jgi:hypothetical protein
MTPVASSTSERGQISIFFSASIVVLISIVAFVINIGLFVKAKINLQNATDAAAYSGAAVQSRQLTKIAYLNWEMRNIYKEWMYKYYVIGNLNVTDVGNPDGAIGGKMSFRLQEDRNVLSGAVAKDVYNFPAVCIHLATSTTNICKRYAIPGLPEFGSSNLPGAEEASRAFMDVLIGSKVNDCIDRTRLNMLVALTWAFNVQTKSGFDATLAGQGPAILAGRQGAWPRAIELAARIRNLEFAANRPPQTSGVCANTGLGAEAGCSTNILDVSGDRKLGSERTVKAFYSGYRNLGNEEDAEMKNSFTLTEIPPRPLQGETPNSASFLLVPQPYEKYYVDLKLMLVNLAVFYAALIPRATNDTSGACDISKVAIPVPGYPMGYYKNPDILTYYAVRGQAMFSGMFNPFDRDAIKLTAYAAAKPFGGRIGPAIYFQKKGRIDFQGRGDNNKRRSVPYIASLNLDTLKKPDGTALALGQFIPGAPLPLNFSNTPPGYFWLKDESSSLGGAPINGDVQFGIPNLVYDYQTPFLTTGYQDNSVKINILRPAILESNLDGAFGLFSSAQFKMFKGTALTNDVSQDTLLNEIYRIRAPTLYETANYLVPSNNTLNLANNLDSFGTFPGAGSNRGGTKVYLSNIYAPLYSNNQADVLWSTGDAFVATVFTFIRGQKSAIDKYKAALNQAANTIYNTTGSSDAQGAQEGYRKAARGVSDIAFGPGDVSQLQPASCSSLAGSFLQFYYGDRDLGNKQVDNITGCAPTLGDLLRSYFGTAAPEFSPTHYAFEYSSAEGPGSRLQSSPKKLLSIFSGYAPGPFTGIGADGMYVSPIPGSQGITEKMQRNSYSTKFVPLDSMQKGNRGYDPTISSMSIYSEGDSANQPTEMIQTDFANSLNPSAIGADLSGVKY